MNIEQLLRTLETRVKELRGLADSHKLEAWHLEMLRDLILIIEERFKK